MRIGRFLLRLLIGGLFFGHGTQKLFGWFNGPGLDGATGMMAGLKLEPARQNAVMASATEATGGLMIATGTLTPVAAAALIGTMITAIRTVLFRNGLWNVKGGYEFNLVLIASLMYLAETGPGCPSVDRMAGLDCGHRSRGLLALAAGAAGSTLVIERGRRLAAAAETNAAATDTVAESAGTPE